MLKKNKFSRKGALLLMVAAVLTLTVVTRMTRASESHTQPDTNSIITAESTHAAQTVAEHAPQSEKFDVGKMIFDHILDAHDWHLWGEGHHAVSIPLPVILYSSRGLDVFMSNKFHHGHDTYKGFKLATPRKIVAVNEMESVDAHHSTINEEVTKSIIDLSITKLVLCIILSGALLIFIMLKVAKGYTDRKGMAPKGIQSLIEPLVIMIRDDVAKASIGPKYEKFMPYLLTAFFFIFLNNLLGLVPFFPGGANLTGNIAVTLTLALITFVIQIVNSKGYFWHHILAMPGVPKPVLAILTPIEILGVFLKPIVLMVRLFANISAGHIVALSFVSMIFIFKQQFGTGGALGISIFSGAMYVFMGFLELLVAFLQAYVFTLLSAIYFGAAVEEEHHH